MRKERLLSRARELMTEAGFRIGMSDGGLVTEAKPMIKWDKVSHCQALINKSYRMQFVKNVLQIWKVNGPLNLQHIQYVGF